MLAVPSAMFTTMSGKSGSLVVRSTPQGHVITPLTHPSNPKTEAQVASRTSFANASEAWRGLSDIQRAGWNNLGKQMLRTNRIGVSRPLTGAQAYVALNTILALLGAAPISEPPSEPETVTPLPSLTYDVERAGTAQGAFSVFVRSSVYAGKVIVLATGPKSAGVAHPGDSEYRIIAELDGLTNGGTDVTAAYTAKYGAGALDSRIFFRVFAVSPSGFKGPEAGGDAIVSVGS